MRRFKIKTIERNIRDGNWEAITDIHGRSWCEIRDCRTGRRFTAAII